ncbi:hypothetical protein EMIT0357P_10379 [Pseudomonas marginalis]
MGAGGVSGDQACDPVYLTTQNKYGRELAPNASQLRRNTVTVVSGLARSHTLTCGVSVNRNF